MIVDTQSAITLFDTGATCSCLSYKTFQKIITNKNLINKKIRVVQADGHSLDPIGTAELGIQLGKEQFKYKFIVCKNLKTPMILGLDFAAYHKIGFDWNTDRSAYLRFENKELVSSIPKWKTRNKLKIKHKKGSEASTTCNKFNRSRSEYTDQGQNRERDLSDKEK